MRDARPKQPTTREGRKKGPVCGATNKRSGKPCQHPAGRRTDHPGAGRCWLHGGVGQVNLPGSRYDDLKARPRLKELVAQYAAEPDPLDLTRELILLRALVQDYVERYDDITASLIAWHASFNGDFELLVRRWRSEVAKYLEEAEREECEPSRPFPVPPYPNENKPRQVLDITAAAGLLDKIGGMADRVEKRKREGSITLATLDRVLEQMGAELVAACQEVRLDITSRTALLTAVEQRWGAIRVDPAAASTRPSGSSQQLN